MNWTPKEIIEWLEQALALAGAEKRNRELGWRV